MDIIKSDFIVIGSGIAGLSAAKYLSQWGQTLILTKGKIKESNTQYAQGGIAVALHSDDQPKFHLEDTLAAGDGLCDLEAVKILVEEGPARVQDLIQMGAQFDKNGDVFDFTKEAAHKKRRILHAGDATGREIEKTLGHVILAENKIKFFENTTVVRLIVNNRECFGCIGVQGINRIAFVAKAVVIGSGGCCQIYSHNTNPPLSTGDGIAMAFESGCSVQDMEFIQFHPTTLYIGDKKPISIFLISEAVRGEGAVLRNLGGERFMERYHRDAELAPRDIVSRSIVSEMQATQSEHVFLDLSGLKVDVQKRFPTIYYRCLEAGIDITKDFIPVSPAAHYFMGGIRTDFWGRTDITRLYAAGEVTSLGIHGANRLASNSLLDGLVFGFRAAQHACEFCLTSAVLGDRFLDEFDKNESDLSHETRSQLLAVKQEVRDIMWRYVGIIRDGVGLRQAIKKLFSLKWVFKFKTFQPDVVEIQNMVILGGLSTHFAITRKESRGAHYRLDYPYKKDPHWQGHLAQTRNQVKPGLIKHSVIV